MFWESFKRNLFKALPWGVVGGVLLFINITNIMAYWNAPGLVGMALQLVWLVSLYFIVGVMLFTFPFYYEMEAQSVWGAVVNAAKMVLANPFFTITIILTLFVLSILSTILFAAWIILTWGAITAVANRAVQDRLMKYRQQVGATG
jgi:uncharacterized membrane protein YesL